MAFVDIKCLESLLIEGKDLIATEGIKDTLSNIGNKIVEILKTLRNKMVELFSKFIKKIKETTGITELENLKAQGSKQQIALLNAIGSLSHCLGYVSKFSSDISKYSKDTVKNANYKIEANNALHQIDTHLDNANEYYEDAFNNQGFKYNKDKLVNQLESVKDTFIKEIDIAIKLYSGPAKDIPGVYGSDLCRVNSKFLTIYSKILQLLI